MLQTVTFIFNQFLHITFSHTFVFSFVQDTPWFCGLILIHLFYSKLLVYSFWRFETNIYNKQGSIEDTSFSFLYNFMTVYITICKYYLSTLHILISVWIFTIHFLRYWQGEFVQHSKLLLLVIISFILMTLICDSGVIL